MVDHVRETQVRAAAFAYLDLVTNHGERPATWGDLKGFYFNGEQIQLRFVLEREPVVIHDVNALAVAGFAHSVVSRPPPFQEMMAAVLGTPI